MGHAVFIHELLRLHEILLVFHTFQNLLLDGLILQGYFWGWVSRNKFGPILMLIFCKIPYGIQSGQKMIMPPETQRPGGTRFECKTIEVLGFCTYGAMVGTMETDFYPHLMPKGMGGNSDGKTLDTHIRNNFQQTTRCNRAGAAALENWITTLMREVEY
jgi:hypothetical protein